MPSWHNLLQVPETALAEMSQLSALLSDALDIADETSQNEQDFVQVRSKGKRTRNYPKSILKQSDQLRKRLIQDTRSFCPFDEK